LTVREKHLFVTSGGEHKSFTQEQ